MLTLVAVKIDTCLKCTSVAEEPVKHGFICARPRGVTFEKRRMFHVWHICMPHEIALTGIIGFCF